MADEARDDSMNKKVAFGPRPGLARAEDAKTDDWVNRRDPEAMKRLTIDVPASLHARIKSQCAIRGVKMADALRELLAQHFQ